MKDDLLLYMIGGFLISILFYYLITRWAHEIEKRNRYLAAQIKLLAKIAEKQGVPQNEITEIINQAK